MHQPPKLQVMTQEVVHYGKFNRRNTQFAGKDVKPGPVAIHLVFQQGSEKLVLALQKPLYPRPSARVIAHKRVPVAQDIPTTRPGSPNGKSVPQTPIFG